MTARRRALAAALAGTLALALGGCDVYDQTLPDKTDAAPDAALDGGAGDAGADAGDAGADAALDSGIDAGS